MRMVDIYLTTEGLLGWRPMLVVVENDTRVLLLDPITIRVVPMKRSEFILARPKPRVIDRQRVREQISAALARAPDHRKKITYYRLRYNERCPLARYALQNLVHRHAKYDVEAALA